MYKKYFCLTLSFFMFLLIYKECNASQDFKIWGPGLKPQIIIMPARYIFIEYIGNNSKQSFLENLNTRLFVNFEGKIVRTEKPCRIWNNILDRKNKSFVIRYKLYETCTNIQISIKMDDKHIGDSPYFLKGESQSDDCDCPKLQIQQFIKLWECGEVPQQIQNDLESFPMIDWKEQKVQVLKEFNKPHSISLCNYIVKDNKVYRRCYGKYVGFKMFMDSILLSLSRKLIIPDIEFFVNLGDWPLVSKNQLKLPILSWCGSTETLDIVMPTYDITESTLEMMGRVMLDILSVQGNIKTKWENRIPKAFWRGRDSNKHRLDLIDISRMRPDLINASLTNFFFFRDQEEKYGPKGQYVSFFDFFEYKYQLSLDGTVAAYRFPYLLAGGSLIFKQTSQYYEHFYNSLEPNKHFIPIKKDLSDLIDKIEWAIQHDTESYNIAKNGQDFSNSNLLPQNIFCYYVHLLNEFHKRLKSKIIIEEDMELVQQKKGLNCVCNEQFIHEEL